MLKKFLAGILMVMVMSGLAMAGIQPSDTSCTDFYHQTPDGEPAPCVGEYQLQDMGEFVSGVWVWDTDFVQAANPWMSGLKDWFGGDENWTWQEQLKPTMTEGGFKTDFYLMRRIYANPDKNPDSRVQVKAFNEGTETTIPVIYLSECRKWDENGEPYSVECPDTFDPTIGDYSYHMNFWNSPEYERKTLESTPTESVDVKSVEWDGVLAEQVPYAVLPHYNYMKYDLNDKTLKLWKSYGIYDDEAVTYWHFDNKVPTEIGPVSLTVTLADDTTFTREVNVTSVDDMPTISAFVDSVNFIKVRPNGKLVTKTKTFANPDVTVVNINVREIDDPDGAGKALVIQWPVPDGALFGSKYRVDEEYQLRLYVGKTDYDLNEEVFLFIDCPPQIGAVVIDAENYNWLKDTMTARGMSLDDIEMTIFYRAVSFENTSYGAASYHNRGYSDKVLFTPVQ